MMSGEFSMPTVNDLIIRMSTSSDMSSHTTAESSPPESSSP